MIMVQKSTLFELWVVALSLNEEVTRRFIVDGIATFTRRDLDYAATGPLVATVVTKAMIFPKTNIGESRCSRA